MCQRWQLNMCKKLAAKSEKFQNNLAESRRQQTRMELEKTQPAHPVG